MLLVLLAVLTSCQSSKVGDDAVLLHGYTVNTGLSSVLYEDYSDPRVTRYTTTISHGRSPFGVLPGQPFASGMPFGSGHSVPMSQVSVSFGRRIRPQNPVVPGNPYSSPGVPPGAPGTFYGSPPNHGTTNVQQNVEQDYNFRLPQSGAGNPAFVRSPIPVGQGQQYDFRGSGYNAGPSTFSFDTPDTHSDFSSKRYRHNLRIS